MNYGYGETVGEARLGRGCLLRRLPAPGQLLGHRGHGGVLHLLERQAVRLPGPVAAQVAGDQVRLVARFVEARASNMSRGPISLPFASWKPRQATRGGPSKREGLASFTAQGIHGPLCEPRIQPSTIAGKANGSSTSPTAGKTPWARTTHVGSSLPT